MVIASSDLKNLGCALIYGQPAGRNHESSTLSLCHSESSDLGTLRSPRLREMDWTSKEADGLTTGIGVDLALRGTGAQIIHSLTSKSLHAPRLFRPSRHAERLPAVVLEDSMTVGDCWEFSGSQGHVAIRLSEPAIVSAFSLAYPSVERLPPTMAFKAPKSVMFWGLSPLTPDLKAPTPLRYVLAKEFTSSNAVHDPEIRPTDWLIPLLHISYNITAPLSHPVFSHQDSFGAWDVIIIQVLNNWGAETTCLYHIGVHGR
jgi:SUN domain-containing protein 5